MPGDVKKSRTLDHIEPESPAAGSAAPALVVAFPQSLALPVPPAVAPAGRLYFAKHGLQDREISSGHVKFPIVDGQQHVQDADSRNGTWLDGQRLEPGKSVVLRDGAVLRLGRTLLVYRQALRGALDPDPPIAELVGPFGLRRVRGLIDALQRHPPSNVLIEGETGTGKELAAQAVAEALDRAEPFAAINVAGVPAGVFESQLFGHVAGAFSDARRASRGIIEAHRGGTVFLDEIGELSLDLQPKLLRLLENREVLPVGGERPNTVDVLLVAATNRRLAELVEQRRFRQDLLSRLWMARLELPPLRDRVEDLYAILQAVAPQCGLDLERATAEVEAVEQLMLRRWPTNVRGLMATLSRVAALHHEPGLPQWAVEQALETSPDGPAAEPAAEAASGTTELSAARVRDALAACGGNQTQAAKQLGISRGKLRRFLEKLDS